MAGQPNKTAFPVLLKTKTVTSSFIPYNMILTYFISIEQFFSNWYLSTKPGVSFVPWKCPDKGFCLSNHLVQIECTYGAAIHMVPEGKAATSISAVELLT